MIFSFLEKRVPGEHQMVDQHVLVLSVPLKVFEVDVVNSVSTRVLDSVLLHPDVLEMRVPESVARVMYLPNYLSDLEGYLLQLFRRSPVNHL